MIHASHISFNQFSLCILACSTDPIAFHASLYYDSYGGILAFNNVKTNIGNAYNSASGRFVAPSFGTYVFSWSIETYHRLTEANIEVNGLVRGSSTADETYYHYETSTSFAILELQHGDNVYIRLTLGQAKATHSMFSGWKLHPTGKQNVQCFNYQSKCFCLNISM